MRRPVRGRSSRPNAAPCAKWNAQRQPTVRSERKRLPRARVEKSRRPLNLSKSRPFSTSGRYQTAIPCQPRGSPERRPAAPLRSAFRSGRGRTRRPSSASIPWLDPLRSRCRLAVRTFPWVAAFLTPVTANRRRRRRAIRHPAELCGTPAGNGSRLPDLGSDGLPPQSSSRRLGGLELQHAHAGGRVEAEALGGRGAFRLEFLEDRVRAVPQEVVDGRLLDPAGLPLHGDLDALVGRVRARVEVEDGAARGAARRLDVEGLREAPLAE